MLLLLYASETEELRRGGQHKLQSFSLPHFDVYLMKRVHMIEKKNV